MGTREVSFLFLIFMFGMFLFGYFLNEADVQCVLRAEIEPVH